ncbi:hypothetical protein [Streptomyces lavendofoliae]|uniref:hypothetical protein n=1 Tax=Streptomyces lavendofoliae TaxID=67314 RepID=UPI003D8CAB03
MAGDVAEVLIAASGIGVEAQAVRTNPRQDVCDRRRVAAALKVHDESIDTARFWERHLAWWTNDAGRQADTLRGRPRTTAEADRGGIATRAAEIALDPTVLAHAQGWTQVLAAYLARASDEQVPYSPGHLIFHQAHTMCNRLGILPREEALLGIMAAQQPALAGS